MRGQGATEYLVLLAVVLIVALVSVALLGFFPGMASDAQMTQSKTYWSGASPISIVEWNARDVTTSSGNQTVLYLRVRNNGAYPLTITKMLAGGLSVQDVWTAGWGPTVTMSSTFVLSPGSEMEFQSSVFGKDPGSGNRRFVAFCPNAGCGAGSFVAGAAASVCSKIAPYGSLVVNNFGFEYTETIDGQTITKKQMGTAALIIKCMDNYN
jgi:hypothetical protein